MGFVFISQNEHEILRSLIIEYHSGENKTQAQRESGPRADFMAHNSLESRQLGKLEPNGKSIWGVKKNKHAAGYSFIEKHLDLCAQAFMCTNAFQIIVKARILKTRETRTLSSTADGSR